MYCGLAGATKCAVVRGPTQLCGDDAKRTSDTIYHLCYLMSDEEANSHLHDSSIFLLKRRICTFTPALKRYVHASGHFCIQYGSQYTGCSVVDCEKRAFVLVHARAWAELQYVSSAPTPHAVYAVCHAYILHGARFLSARLVFGPTPGTLGPLACSESGPGVAHSPAG